MSTPEFEANAEQASAVNFREAYLSRTAIRLHLTLVFGATGCLLAGWFELTRALGGREIAWVYTFEWPMFAVVGCWIWWRLLHPDSVAARPNASSTKSAMASSPSAGSSGDIDHELLAWQNYLAQLHADDPPGAPPSR
jgi:hypothetical protein